MVLGSEFLVVEDRHGVNIDMSLRFIAPLLELGELKRKVMTLAQFLIQSDFLGNLDSVLAGARLGVGIHGTLSWHISDLFLSLSTVAKRLKAVSQRDYRYQTSSRHGMDKYIHAEDG
ncbi:hypothetical protein SUGI_0491600 [Cryptomeria japonica]|nr:hypothetical protein SUGI_0491600 [Cryptomeria japonica]